MQLHAMWDEYPALSKDLQEVLQTIEKNIQIRDKHVEQNVKDLIHAGGKLLRPAFALLSAQAGPDYDKDRAVSIAAALEVLHMATLIHDDVVDDSPLRRGSRRFTLNMVVIMPFILVTIYSASVSKFYPRMLLPWRTLNLIVKISKKS